MQTSHVNFTALAALSLLAACGPTAGAPARDSAGSKSPNQVGPATSAPLDSLLTRADQGRIEGSPDAKVWFVIVSDFQCPYCKQWHDETLEAVRAEYVKTGKVRMAYINYPLGNHQHAWPTATAAMCAAEQSKFWQYHDAVFATQQKWAAMPSAAALLDSLAGSVGVGMRQWRECVASDRMRAVIRSDKSRAEAAGVNSTPTFLIGDRGLSGARTIAELRPVIDSAVTRAAGVSR